MCRWQSKPEPLVGRTCGGIAVGATCDRANSNIGDLSRTANAIVRIGAVPTEMTLFWCSARGQPERVLRLLP